ncbi:MAG: hypothetical protein NC343_07885 [Muribaculum sp.]|nr:hypothetical protein [Muribaculaceae bacterium]MCM1081656.1 hypothetical protein [Muribaculum sp.]
MKVTFVILLLLFTSQLTMAQSVSTIRPGNLKPISHKPELNIVDSIITDIVCDSIQIHSYDKPLRSLRETFFVANKMSGDTISSVQLTLTYTAVADSTMLHSRTATIPCNIPPQQTRQLYLIAWDRQYTYFSENTRIKPQNTKAIEYRTAIELNGATIKKRLR